MVDDNLIFYIAETELNLKRIKEVNHIENEVEQAKKELEAIAAKDPDSQTKDFRKILYNAMTSRRNL